MGCTALEQVTDMPMEMDEIGDRAFAGCCKLQRFMVPSNVARIGSGVFEGCDDLTNEK